MTLDDIVNQEILRIGGQTGLLGSVKQRIEAGKGPSDNGHYDQGVIASVVQNMGGELTPEQIQTALEAPTEIAEPIVTRHLTQAYENARDSLLPLVEDNYQEIIRGYDHETLVQFAVSTPVPDNVTGYEEVRDAKERFQKFANAHAEGDTQTYLDSIDNPVIREIYEQLPDVVPRRLEERVKHEQGRLLTNFVGEDGNLDYEEIKSYLETETEYQKPEDKERVYEMLGTKYANTLSQRAQDSANAEYQSDLAEAE